MDVHVPQAITDQLRLRGVDVITAQEDGADEFDDTRLLLRASELRRVVFTHDIRFHALAVRWQQEGKPFAGLLFGDQTGVGIGPYVRDLEIVAKASEPNEWMKRRSACRSSNLGTMGERSRSHRRAVIC